MSLTIVGLVLIAFGVLYLRRPAVYRKGVWMKTSIAIRMLSEDGYRRYIKGLGVVFILIGLGCIAWKHGLADIVMRVQR